MKLRLSSFIIVIMCFLVPVQTKAETIILPPPNDPEIINVDFTANNGKKLYKTGDNFNISFQVNNMTYSSGKSFITIFYSIKQIDIIYDIENNTTTISNNNSWLSDCIIQFDKDSGRYDMQITTKEDPELNLSFSIEHIIVKGDKEVGTEKCRYVFAINDNCVSGNHTIKQDTRYTIDKFATCTTKGSQSKKCIICDNIIEDTIEEIPVTEHKPSKEYVIIKHATCVEKGTQGKKCIVCGEVLEDTIQETPIDPNYHIGGWTKAETEEYYYAKCNSCGADLYHNFTSIDGIFMDGKRLNIGEEYGAFEIKGGTINEVTPDVTQTVTQPDQNNSNTQTGVRPIENNPQTPVQSATKDAQTITLSIPTLKSVKNNKKKTITITWGKVTDANGYEVQYALNKKFTKNKKSKTVTKNKIISLTVNKLKKGKTYYVRVRAYNVGSDDKKVFSGWSKVKKVKVKKR